MKTKIPTINNRKINTQIIAAKCRGNFNLVFNIVKIGSNKTANKNAMNTGVRISFAMQKI